MMHGRETLLTHMKYCGNAIASAAGGCEDQDSNSLESVLFEVSNFTDKNESVWVVVW